MSAISNPAPNLTCLERSHSKWPEIPGLETFKGHKVHSANWDHSYDYANKRIAVIGNGSSGIQIVPQMAALPGTEVTNFTRSPVYVYYRVPPSQHLGEKAGANKNPSYSDETKQQFREDAEFYREFRRAMIRRTNKAFRMVRLFLRTPCSPDPS